jgi:uncharacterized protein with von Willebrand factor type A (vWA) domain
VTTWREPETPSKASGAGPTDFVELAVRFGDLLRQHGIPVVPEREARWVRCLSLLGAASAADLYWSGRLTLVSGSEELSLYDELFRAFWSGDPVPGRAGNARSLMSRREGTARSEPRQRQHQPGAGEGQGAERLLPGMAAWAARSGARRDAQGAAAEEAGEGRAARGLYSALEVLRDKDFRTFRQEDAVALARALARAEAWPPELRSRRRRPRGAELDLRRTLAASARTGTDPVRRYGRRPGRRHRRWVVLCDVSNSMGPYSLGLLAFLHALARLRPATEVFAFGTRLSRLTPWLRRAPAEDLPAIPAAAQDFGGGTRLGSCLEAFRKEWGRRGLAHGALVVVISDGLDLGEVEVVEAEMRWLRRTARRLAWVNPLRASPGYQPLARAMAAALRYVDAFASGHDPASLMELFRQEARRTYR